MAHFCVAGKAYVKIPKIFKKKLVVIGAAVMIVVLAVLLILIFPLGKNGDKSVEQSTGMQNQTTQSEDSKQEGESTATDELDADNIPINDSGSTPKAAQGTNQPQSSSSSSTSESDTPLCQRKYLSDEEVRYCADKLQQEREEEIRKNIEESRNKWCDENMPGIYARYNNELLAENSRYEREIENYVNSHIGSGVPGSESTYREIAEKQYSPLHVQMTQSIVNNYISEVQGYGCDLSKYSF